MKIRNYRLETKSDSYLQCDSIAQVERLLNGLPYVCSEPDQLGDVIVSVPAYAAERKQYAELKSAYCNIYGAN